MDCFGTSRRPVAGSLPAIALSAVNGRVPAIVSLRGQNKKKAKQEQAQRERIERLKREEQMRQEQEEREWAEELARREREKRERKVCPWERATTCVRSTAAPHAMRHAAAAGWCLVCGPRDGGGGLVGGGVRAEQSLCT